ncbi:hypothetical protein [Agrobacterium tumefaciens]|uniref:hypothetical protein n=1 Tax=Agrobacterium tumefaciens TaxID=358 RepID=UPI000DD507DA|nr:hypothetical protein [Agrobacterium tumefaciens]MDX8327395.1 hypothetical protein [Agrobacterium tumefaciens]MRH98140.1 hypothetical protein [Agrobacterium tumefaciens]
MKITMHVEEVALLSSVMKGSDSYFEFGMGGSTYLAAGLVKNIIHAVDTSQDWVDKVSAAMDAQDKEVSLRRVDVGPTGEWGFPISRLNEANFPSYSLAILESGVSYDLCLVDGRFRVACFLQAVKSLRSDSVIAFHDYSVRPEYHLVENFARPIATNRTLTLFVRRADCDFTNLDATLTKYRLNWA